MSLYKNNVILIIICNFFFLDNYKKNALEPIVNNLFKENFYKKRKKKQLSFDLNGILNISF